MEEREKFDPQETDEDVEGHTANPAGANPLDREASEEEDVEGHGFNPQTVNPQ